MRVLFLIGLMSFSLPVAADYCAVDVPTATVCNGLVIKSCSTYNLLYLQRDNVKYEFGPCFKNVTQYQKSSNKCHISLDRGLSITGWAVDQVSLPEFYGRPVKGGPTQRLQPDHISFECVKR